MGTWFPGSLWFSQPEWDPNWLSFIYTPPNIRWKWSTYPPKKYTLPPLWMFLTSSLNTIELNRTNDIYFWWIFCIKATFLLFNMEGWPVIINLLHYLYKEIVECLFWILHERQWIMEKRKNTYTRKKQKLKIFVHTH